MLGNFRRRIGVRARNRDRKRWPTEVGFEVIRENESIERKVIAAGEFPRILFLPKLPPPDILKSGLSEAVPEMWIMYHKKDVAEAKAHGGKGFAAGRYDMSVFCRTIAKIAHSYALAELGPSFSCYRPLLTDLIRFGTGDPRAFVGGDMVEPPPQPFMYNVGYFTQRDSEREYACVFVRLFSFMAAPLYQAAVGERALSSFA